MLVFWYPGVNPYLVERFNALYAAATVPFHYVATRGVDDVRDWDGDIPTIDFPMTVLHDAFTPFSIPADLMAVSRLIKEIGATTLVSLHGYPETMASAIVPTLSRGVDLYFYIEKTFDAWIRRTRLKEVGKRVILRRASGVLAPGQDGWQYARRYSRTLSYFQLRHAIPDSFRAGSFDRSDLRTRFLYLGRPVPEKGIHELLGAWEELRRVGVEATLQIVGGQLPTRLAQHAARLDVHVEPYVPRAHVPELLRGTDCLVFPSWGDPYGLVVDEALACGVPVISSSSVGEIDSRITHGVNGLIVKAGVGLERRLKSALEAVCDRSTQAMLASGARATKVARLGDWVNDVEAFWQETRRHPSPPRGHG